MEVEEEDEEDEDEDEEDLYLAKSNITINISKIFQIKIIPDKLYFYFFLKEL